ncbi:unnamed protein product [Microthlaspi erraticum]|uniref:Uncharacterized protein n=1 Tax=Microthlaspi erraticum TaxID=1685480 RepID=A0A6D2IR38_9BRAS|nr:unnamed protein product [Microthlaspi erraticum]
MNIPRSAKIKFVRLKSRPKFKSSRPGKQCPAVGHATPTQDDAAHDHAARAGKQRLAAAQPYSCTMADGAVRAGKATPASGRETSANPSSSDQAADHESVRPRPFRLGHDPIVRPIVPTDRPNAAVDPKPVLKPVSRIFKARLNPKPPLKT